MQLVISDAHRGLVDAIGAALPGACWQRCRTQYLRNLLTKVPKSAQPWVATMVRTVFDQPDTESVRDQFDRVVDAIAAKYPDAGAHLDDAREDLLAFTGFPHEIWRQIWSNNPQERLNKEIRRRTDVVGIFPNRAAIIRLVGAVLAGEVWRVAVSSRSSERTTPQTSRGVVRVEDVASSAPTRTTFACDSVFPQSRVGPRSSWPISRCRSSTIEFRGDGSGMAFMRGRRGGEQIGSSWPL